MRIWTQGVAELLEALGVGDDKLLRVLKDFYGSTTAPRGLWLDLHATFTSLGATKILSDPCMWIWTEPNPNPRNDMDRFKTIGMMGGHVDDFNRAGDMENPRWLELREKIDKAYKWDAVKRGSYRPCWYRHRLQLPSGRWPCDRSEPGPVHRGHCGLPSRGGVRQSSG